MSYCKFNRRSWVGFVGKRVQLRWMRLSDWGKTAAWTGCCYRHRQVRSLCDSHIVAAVGARKTTLNYGTLACSVLWTVGPWRGLKSKASFWPSPALLSPTLLSPTRQMIETRVSLPQGESQKLEPLSSKANHKT